MLYMVQRKNCFTASINMKFFSAYCSSKLCLPCYAGYNKMLYFGKFHLRLLGNPNMLHAPNNHFVFQPGFQNRNQSKVHLFTGCKVRKLGPHIFLQSLFLRICFFEGIKNLLTCSGVSSLPLPLCERLILLSPKEKSTDLMANFICCQNFSCR